MCVLLAFDYTQHLHLNRLEWRTPMQFNLCFVHTKVSTGHGKVKPSHHPTREMISWYPFLKYKLTLAFYTVSILMDFFPPWLLSHFPTKLNWYIYSCVHLYMVFEYCHRCVYSEPVFRRQCTARDAIECSKVCRNWFNTIRILYNLIYTQVFVLEVSIQ